MRTVLVVEDDRALRDVVGRYLQRAGHHVVATGRGAEALEHLRSSRIDLVVLDLGLPDVDGEEVLRAAVAAGPPVVVVTARAAPEQRIRGLELGADDYVTKPFSPRELVLRVHAVLHRTVRHGAGTVPVRSFGDGRLVVDEARHEVVVDGGLVSLTPKQWALLAALTAEPGLVLSRVELVDHLHGDGGASSARTVDSHVKSLRRKLHDDAASPRLVETVPGVGYRLGVRRDR